MPHLGGNSEAVESIRRICRNEMKLEFDSFRAELRDIRIRLERNELSRDQVPSEYCGFEKRVSSDGYHMLLPEEPSLQHMQKKECIGPTFAAVQSTTPDPFRISEMQSNLFKIDARLARVEEMSSSASSCSASPYQNNARDCFRMSPHEQNKSMQGEFERSATLEGEDFSHVPVTIANTVHADAPTLSEEYRQILYNAKEEYELMHDVWGAATFVILKDLPDVSWGDIKLENILRISLVFFVLALNLFFQFMFLYWIGILVMLPNVASIQDAYRTFHDVAFDRGHFNELAFDSLTDFQKGRICDVGISKTMFMAACIFLWVAKCCHEMRQIYRRRRSLEILPALPLGVASTHMVHEVQYKIGNFYKERRNMIVCLDRRTYIWLHVLIFVPRYVISSLLLVAGMTFLTATASFDDLILNSLSLSFVFDIDVLFYKCFLPLRLDRTLGISRICAPPEYEAKHMTRAELDVSLVKRVYRRSIVVCCFCFLTVCAWFVVQPVLPGYEYDVTKSCSKFLTVKTQKLCRPFEGNCFPK